MRDRGNIFNYTYFQPGGLQGTNRCFPARPRSFYHYFHLFHTVPHCLFSRGFSSRLSSERRTFPGAFKSSRAGAGPGNGVSFRISDRNHRIVKSRLDMSHSVLNIFTFPSLGSNGSASQINSSFFVFSAISSGGHLQFCAGLCASGRLFSCAGHVRAFPGGGAILGNIRFQSAF